MLDDIAHEYDFVVHRLEATSPAGQRLAQVSGLPQFPGIYIDLKLVAWGRPTRDELVQAIIYHST